MLLLLTKIDKISVAITSEQHAKIKAAVERGDYATTSEVIRTALREWELKEELRRLEGERIGRLWDEGIVSGPARRRDIDDIVADARKAVDGPPVMGRLRRKYAALDKSAAAKTQRRPKR